jgi:hypothetical protein
MKIIAKTGEKTFLVQATEDELANLIGWSSEWHRKDRRQRGLCIGDTINTHAMFSRLYEQENQRSELDKAKSILMKAAASIDKAAPVFERIVHPNHEKE